MACCGEVYTGNWVAGRSEGEGKYCYSDGDIYEGATFGKFKVPCQIFKHFGRRRHCTAKTCSPGEWKNGYRHGQGTCLYKGGADVGDEIYSGQWKYGVQHGSGTYNYADGAVYVGLWKDGVMTGQGEFRYANGNVL